MVKKELDSEPIYNKRFLNPKIKSYGDETIHDEKMPKVGSNYICQAAVLIDFVLKKDNKYFPQVFLEEWKYIEKEKKVTRYTTDDLQISFDDSDNSDEK